MCVMYSDFHLFQHPYRLISTTSFSGIITFLVLLCDIVRLTRTICVTIGLGWTLPPEDMRPKAMISSFPDRSKWYKKEGWVGRESAFTSQSLERAFPKAESSISLGSCTRSGQLNSIQESTPFPVSSQPHACGSVSCSSQVRLQHHACLSVAILPAIMIRASPSGTVSPKNSFS